MPLSNFPAMLVSESTGWADVDHAHHSRRWYFFALVVPLSLLPPLLYAYAELNHPGVIFPIAYPEMTTGQFIATGVAYYCAELIMVGYLAMLMHRVAMARDHDPGPDGPYALATIAIVPFWIASLGLVVPSLGFNLALMGLAGLASIVLIRHGVRPLLHIPDEKVAHTIADTVTLAGIAAWIGLTALAGLTFSFLLTLLALL